MAESNGLDAMVWNGNGCCLGVRIICMCADHLTSDNKLPRPGFMPLPCPCSVDKPTPPWAIHGALWQWWLHPSVNICAGHVNTLIACLSASWVRDISPRYLTAVAIRSRTARFMSFRLICVWACGIRIWDFCPPAPHRMYLSDSCVPSLFAPGK